MNFLNSYSKTEYIKFFQDNLLTDSFRIIEEEIKPEFIPQFIKKAELIGRDKSLELEVYEIQHASENDPRVGLSKDFFRLMANYGSKRALAIFYSPKSKNYRLSLATVDLSLDGSRVKREYSNPRRYSFFLGSDSKIHTPSEFLIKRGRVSDFDDLQERFSVEVVNKEFYQRIAVQFSRLVGGQRKIGNRTEDFRRTLSLPSVTEHNIFQEFAVRLIGRLVFCWFLKMKKSDIGRPLISNKVLSLESVKVKNNYYHDVLEKLFFEVLNTPIDDRGREFKQEPYLSIPFLNGGLFNPHSYDFYDVGRGGISKHLNTLKVPDKWLQEFIEILETYNFTVDENTSVDIDLSVDPEMLGRIFENLLAEINPETGESARKATGSYYTPRPIVEYMVDESLKQYLMTEAKIEENKISNLLSYSDGEIDLTDKEKEKIIDAFDKVRILDPACGSGAFPIGILQKMLLVLKRVDPKSRMWLNKQLARVPTAALRNELKNKLEDENVEYIHKLGIIQNSIYGVDIQPIAAEISKLRCFLSLIVDEKIYDDKANRGVLPLPNLEFKFVAANTLIALPKASSQSELFNVDEEIQKIEDLRKQYFTAIGKYKETTEEEFLNAQKELAANYFKKQAKDNRAIKIANWNPFSDDATPWFDPEWMFGLVRGFDIVICNPPYIGQKGNKTLFENFKTDINFETKMDYWYFFLHKAYNITKENGINTFITPNYWITAQGGKKIRKRICTNYRIIEYINFNENAIFATGVHTNIFVLKKNESPNINIKCTIYQNKYSENIFGYRDLELNFYTDQNKILSSWTNFVHFLPSNIFEIIQILIVNCEKLSDDKSVGVTKKGIIPGKKVTNGICNISPGIESGKDKGIYVLSQEEIDDLELTHEETKMVKRFFKNSDINKYFISNYSDSYFLYVNSIELEVEFRKFKNLYAHFVKHKRDLTKRARNGVLKSAFKKGKWWALKTDRPNIDWASNKIVCPQRSKENTFALVNESFLSSVDIYYISKNRDGYDLKYILAILNSKTIYFWLYWMGKRKGELLELYFEPLQFVPIKRISIFEQEPFTSLVNKIIEMKNLNPLSNTKKLEDRIDLMVYKLYNLTYEEVKIIDPEIEKIIKIEEYEKLQI